MSALETVGSGSRVDRPGLGGVPVIDATGLVALESAIERLRLSRKLVVIAGPLPEPRSVFEKANLEVEHEHVFLADTVDDGVQLAHDLILLTPEAAKPPVPTARPA